MKLNRLLVVSALVHAAAFAWMMHADRRVAPSVATVSEPAAELEVEIEPAATATERVEEPAVAEPVASPNEVAAVTTTRRDRSGGSGVTGAGSATGGPAGAGSSEPALAGSNSTWVVELGPGAVVQPFRAMPPSGNPFMPKRQEAEAEDRARELPHKDDSLKYALSVQDAAKGLGPDGPVLHALEDETRTSLAPLRGSATFHAIIDATGFVTSLTVTDSTGDTMGWNDARDHALAALQKKKLDLRGAKNGASLDIYVESKMRLPAGNESSEYGVKDGMLTMGGDLSNLGSKPSRVVHARLANFTPL